VQLGAKHLNEHFGLSSRYFLDLKR